MNFTFWAEPAEIQTHGDQLLVVGGGEAGNEEEMAYLAVSSVHFHSSALLSKVALDELIGVLTGIRDAMNDST